MRSCARFHFVFEPRHVIAAKCTAMYALRWYTVPEYCVLFFAGVQSV